MKIPSISTALQTVDRKLISSPDNNSSEELVCELI